MWLAEIIFFALYQFVFWPLAITTVWLMKNFNPKLRKLYEQRRAAVLARGLQIPVFAKPPIWIHAASGEFEYAKPIIRKIKAKDATQPIFVTYFSPSYADSITKTPGVDGSAPLPLDLPGPVRGFLDNLKPKALLIARTDVWPELIKQVHERNIPSLLFSATIKPQNRVQRWYQKWIGAKLSQIFVVSLTDEQRLLALGVRNVEIHGDTQFDQVIDRLEHPKQISFIPRDERPILIAGSTWPEDEQVLLPSVQALLREKMLRLIIAPHELNHLDRLRSQLNKMQIDSDMYSGMSSTVKSVLIIDQVGILAELYTLADFAFVGGSFRRKVHSVKEPLAAGLTTIVGPHHTNNREAIEFQSILGPMGAAVRAIRDSKQLSTEIVSILDQRSAWAETKQFICHEVSRRAGGSEAVMKWLQRNIV